MSYCDYFKGKKITVMGLGLLGRGVGDTAFLSECGVDLIVTDLKSEKELAPSLSELKTCTNIKYVLGEHRKEDFINRDMILKAAGVPADSEYLEEAKSNGVPIEMSASLVARLSPATIIGITGTRGKSTVTQLIYHILQNQKRKVHLGGNVRGVATLPILEHIEEGDIVVMELDSWQMQGFGTSKISPHISVFTTFFPDHMNYYPDMQTYFNDKANIYKYQKNEDVLIVSPQAHEAIHKYDKHDSNSKTIVVDPLPVTNRSLSGVHNKYNAACAVEVAREIGMNEEEIQKAISTFPGVEGRLQFVRDVNGVHIYNDNNATTPDATIAGLKALSRDKNIILIMGGSDKGLNMNELISEIPKHCKAVVLFKEKGTDRIKDEVMNIEGLEVKEEENLEACVKSAYALSQEGDILLYSPAFASFGKYFKNEYDRNDQFLNIVEKL